MTLTKYEHSCLVIEQDGQRLVIDPGIYSQSFQNLADICAVLISHIHRDHLDKDKINAIVKLNPAVKVYTTSEVADEIKPIVSATVVHSGDKHESGPFRLEFFGGQHALIHQSYPLAQNIGVMVNDNLYYPGDSFVAPGKPVSVLAVPAHAPWAKVSESIDFIGQVRPKRVFPAHNHFLNDDGRALYDRLLSGACVNSGCEYISLVPADKLEI